MKKISIIIPTMPDPINRENLRVCLTSLFKYKSPDWEYEVFVQANFWDGFSIPNNEAIKKATAEYLLLLNDDTEILGPGWEDLMVKPFEQKSVGIVGHSESIQHGKYSAMWCTLVKKELFDKIGLLDEELNIYSNDIDFGYRALKEGFKTFFVDLPIRHYWCKTTNRLENSEELKKKSKELFFKKHGVEHDLC